MLVRPLLHSRWLTLGIVGLGVSIGPLDSAVNIAFPTITASFNIPLPAIQWVIICYVLTYASLLLGCGRLGDIVGHRRVFLFGLGWSVVSYVLCAQASTFGWFLLARGLQGVGTALVLSCGPALATLAFPESERGRILGLYNMVYAMAYAAGPLIGGLLVSRWGWPGVFYFRAPLAFLSALLMWGVFRRPVEVKPGQGFDVLGAVTVTLSLASFLLAFNQAQHRGWLSLPVLLLFGSACGCLALFVRQERRFPEPLIDLGLFRQGAFTIANIAHVLANAASFTILLLVPFYLLNYYHASTILGGLLLAVAPLGAVAASPVSGWLLSRFAARRLSLTGLCFIVLGLCGIGTWRTDSALSHMAIAMWMQGVGMGLFQVANMDFVMGVIPRTHQGVAGSLTVLTRTIGVVSCATMGSLLLSTWQISYAEHLQASGVSMAAAQSQAFMLAFHGVFRGAAIVSLIAAALIWGSRFASTPARAKT